MKLSIYISKKNLIKITLYITCLSAICAIFVLYFILVKNIYPNMIDIASFGDMFGGINAIFSGLAFLGVIYTIILQGKELQLQREELRLTREELKRTAVAQEKSEHALSKQAESLRLTAKLNGLSAILAHHDKDDEISALEMGKSSRPYSLNIRNDTSKIIRQIEEIIENK